MIKRQKKQLEFSTEALMETPKIFPDDNTRGFPKKNPQKLLLKDFHKELVENYDRILRKNFF